MQISAVDANVNQEVVKSTEVNHLFYFSLVLKCLDPNSAW